MAFSYVKSHADFVSWQMPHEEASYSEICCNKCFNPIGLRKFAVKHQRKTKLINLYVLPLFQAVLLRV